MLVAGFLKVWPIHRHFLLRMVTSILSCLIRCHSSSFEIFLGHHTPKMYQSLRLVKVWSWVMIFFVNLEVSDPYRRTDFTLELKILIFVHSEMNFDLHMGLKMENATCAFLHLASTSSSVLPEVVIRLPRYVKADTCSRTSPTQQYLLGTETSSPWFWTP